MTNVLAGDVIRECFRDEGPAAPHETGEGERGDGGSGRTEEARARNERRAWRRRHGRRSAHPRCDCAPELCIQSIEEGRHVDHWIWLQVNCAAEQGAGGRETPMEQRVQRTKQQHGDEALSVSARADVQRERIEEPEGGTRPTWHLPLGEYVLDERAHDQIGGSKENLAKRRVQPHVGRQQRREQRRVPVCWPLKGRASMPHEVSSVGKDVVINVRVADLEQLVVKRAIDDERKAQEGG